MKKTQNIKKAHEFIHRIAEAVLLYAVLPLLFDNDGSLKQWLVMFAFLWVGTDLARYFYVKIVVPAAREIAK